MKFQLLGRKVSFLRVLVWALLSIASFSSASAQFAGGSGTRSDPFQLATPAHLDAVRDRLDASYILTAELDLTGVVLNPIGSQSSPFSGTFDGANFAIRNWLHSSGGATTGLFGATASTATIARVRLLDLQLTGGNSTGGLVGENQGTISNCEVTGSLDGHFFTGGVVGTNRGLVYATVVDAVVTTPSGWVGGVVGWNIGQVVDCVATGAVDGGAEQGNVGGLVGSNDSNGGLIERCRASATVTGNLGVGGLVGLNSNRVVASSASGAVTANSYAGGLIGMNYPVGVVRNSFATGAVTAGFAAGGLVGSNLAAVVNAYSSGAVGGGNTTSHGGLIGLLEGEGTVASSYWNLETSGRANSAGGIGKTSVELTQESTFTGWDFTAVWMAAVGEAPALRADAPISMILGAPQITNAAGNQDVVAGTRVFLWVEAAGTPPLEYRWTKDGAPIDGATNPLLELDAGGPAEGGTYHVVVTNFSGTASSTMTLAVLAPATFGGGNGTPSDPYLIASVAQLQAVHAGLDRHYSLTADLDLAGVSFLPIGSPNQPFTGSFDGRSFAIHNWTFGAPATHLGFFSAIGTAGRVSNLRILDGGLFGSNYAGLLAASNHGLILDVEASGTVSGGYYLGGVAGENAGTMLRATSAAIVDSPLGVLGGLVGRNSGTIADGVATGSVTGGIAATNISGMASVGGLVGENYLGASVLRSRASGNVAGTHSVGGLVGLNQGIVSYASASGMVTGADYVGGLIGLSAAGRVNDSYASGTVVSTHMAAGGLLGTKYDESLVANTYARGAVTGGGGLIGVLNGEPIEPVSSYWDVETTGQSSSIGGVGLTTAQMKNQGSYVNWDFSQIWSISSGEYPTIRADVPLAPVIISQPASQTVVLGQSATFSVVLLDGNGVTYQWRKDGVDLPGTNSPTFMIPATVATDAGDYTVQATTIAGAIVSQAATLTLSLPPTIVTQPQPQVAAGGSFVSISVVAVGEGALTYQWRKNGLNLPGENAPVLNIPDVAASHAGFYSVVVGNAVGTVTSDEAQLTVVFPPQILTHPQSQSAIVGDSVTFTVSASGDAPLSYQWWAKGAPVPDATSDSLTIASVSLEDDGLYNVLVTNGAGATWSATATLSVTPPPPVITQQPQSASLYAGEDVIFQVSATSTESLGYSWSFTPSGSGSQGQSIGWNSPTLSIADVQQGDAGTYICTIYYGGYALNTVPATLVVQDGAPTIVRISPSQTVYPGTYLILGVDALGTGPLSYQWFKNSIAIAGATAATLDLGQAGGGTFMVEVTNSFGTVNSDPVVLNAANAPAFAGGSGTVADPYLIANAAQLEGMRNRLAGHFRLAADIDLSGIPFAPIHNPYHGFRGSLDGAGFTISNWDNPTPNYGSGFFTTIDATGRVSNLTLTNATVEGDGPAGIIAGTLHGLIENCSIDGTAISHHDAAGGLAGYAAGLIIGSDSAAYVNSPSSYAGGLVGQGSGTILDSFATGDISGLTAGGLVGIAGGRIERSHATGTVTGEFVAGGLVGSGLGGEIKYSYATGSVGSPGFAGGLIGENSNTPIHNAYATGSVYGLRAGGLVGAMSNGIMVTNTLAIGAVTAAPGGTAGGLYAYNHSPTTPFAVNSYWDPVATGVATSLAGEPKCGTELRTAATYVDWDFTTIWSMIEGEYPTLRSTGPVAPVIIRHPTDLVFTPGDTLMFDLEGLSAGDVYYYWLFNGDPIDGAEGPTLTIVDAQASHAGEYVGVIGSSLGESYSIPVFAILPEGPTVTQIDPTTAPAGAAGVTLRLQGAGFNPESVVHWNGSPRPTTYLSQDVIIAEIPGSDLTTPDGVSSALITVQQATGGSSPAFALPIVTSDVQAVTSVAIPANTSGEAFSLPADASGAGLSASFQNNSGTNVALTLATYSSNPTPVPHFDLGGAYVDLQILGASVSDVAVTSFYYPATISGGAETDLVLQYFDGNAWQAVLSSGAINPVKDTTDNLDGTISGGRFGVQFDATSVPSITELGGTVFAFVQPEITGGTATRRPKITTQPADATVTVGQSAIFSVVVSSDGPVTYQWRFDGKKSKHNIPGATFATLTVANVTSEHEGDYYVVVTNSKGSVISKKAKLKVSASAPVISVDPLSQSVGSGADVTLSLTATGEGRLEYQWFRDGKKLGGEGKARLVIENAKVKDSGSYTVVVTNDGGSVTSAPAQLIVSAPVIAAIDPTTVAAGSGSFTLTVTGANFVSGAKLHWDGQKQTTEFVSETQLTAHIPAKDIPAKKKNGKTETVKIRVESPSGEDSNVVLLSVTP